MDKKLVCSFCDFRTSNLTKIGSKSYCVICRLTLKPNTHETHKIVAAYSIHQQMMINKLYREFILKNNTIPTFYQIDPNCRLININPTLLHEIINLMSEDDKMCFMNIKYFLTDEVNIKEIKTVNFFNMIGGNYDKVNGCNNETNGVNRINLLKHQKNLFDKYYQKFTDNNLINIQNLFKQ
jgi:hypothetical protein